MTGACRCGSRRGVHVLIPSHGGLAHRWRGFAAHGALDTNACSFCPNVSPSLTAHSQCWLAGSGATGDVPDPLARSLTRLCVRRIHFDFGRWGDRAPRRAGWFSSWSRAPQRNSSPPRLWVHARSVTGEPDSSSWHQRAARSPPTRSPRWRTGWRNTHSRVRRSSSPLRARRPASARSSHWPYRAFDPPPPAGC